MPLRKGKKPELPPGYVSPTHAELPDVKPGDHSEDAKRRAREYEERVRKGEKLKLGYIRRESDNRS